MSASRAACKLLCAALDSTEHATASMTFSWLAAVESPCTKACSADGIQGLLLLLHAASLLQLVSKAHVLYIKRGQIECHAYNTMRSQKRAVADATASRPLVHDSQHAYKYLCTLLHT